MVTAFHARAVVHLIWERRVAWWWQERPARARCALSGQTLLTHASGEMPGDAPQRHSDEICELWNQRMPQAHSPVVAKRFEWS